MSDLGLSGIASGVDTSAIVEKLMAVERQGTTRLTLRQTALKAHQSALRAIASKLNALRDAASALASSDVWQTRQSAESSDPSHVTATLLAGAGIGGHTVQVDRLASSAQHGYAWTPPGAATTLDLYDPSDPSDPAAAHVTINVAANATAQDV